MGGTIVAYFDVSKSDEAQLPNRVTGKPNSCARGQSCLIALCVMADLSNSLLL